MAGGLLSIVNARKLMCSIHDAVKTWKIGTHFATKLVHEHLQSIPPRVRSEVNRWSKRRPILCASELDNN